MAEAYSYRMVVALRDDSDLVAAGMAAAALSGREEDLSMWEDRPAMTNAAGDIYLIADTSLFPSQVPGLPAMLGSVYPDAASYAGGAAFGESGDLLGGVWFTREPGEEERPAITVLLEAGFLLMPEEGEV